MSAGALESIFANPLAANPNFMQQSVANVTALRNYRLKNFELSGVTSLMATPM